MEEAFLVGIFLFVVLSLVGGIGASTAAGDGYGSGPFGGSDSYGSGSQSGSAGSQGGSMTDVGGSDIDILARTIYGEARGSGEAAQQGVANVVINRYRAGFKGGSIAGVCRAPYQFSCWNANDKNLPIIEAVTNSNSMFVQCLQIATLACNGSLPDNTGGALYYHDTSIKTPKAWGAVVETTQIATLIFYKPELYA